MIHQKHGRRGWGVGGGGGAYFLYLYKKNFKNLLVRNDLTDFNITWQEYYFGDPLPRLLKQSWFVKNIAERGRGLFSLYDYIENFKNLLIRNHWTDFNITLQEFSFGGPLPSLFMIRQNMADRGMAYFPIYLYKTL